MVILKMYCSREHSVNHNITTLKFVYDFFVVEQLMYDRTDGGRIFRTYISCNLGWWHTYKLVAFKLWKEFAPNLIAPLWHHLYPNSQFHIKPSSFSSVLYHYLALHWSYPSFKDELKGLLEVPADQTSRRFTNTVKDLIFFFEYAVPTVRFCCVCLIFQETIFSFHFHHTGLGLRDHDETRRRQVRHRVVEQNSALIDDLVPRQLAHVHSQHHDAAFDPVTPAQQEYMRVADADGQFVNIQ
jgi:hypothetical protein